MREIVSIYKKIGETPLQAMNRLRYEQLEFANQKMTYLGRLDPMAEGLLLVLVGDTKGKEEYLNFDKEYEFEVLWGFETDTYDILGLLVRRDLKFSPLNPQAGSDTDKNFKSLLTQIQSIKKQTYPPYSSKKVIGKQLWQWARDGENVERPERDIKIYSIEHLKNREKTGAELLREIVEKINLVKGDFRQKEIKKLWQEALGNRKEEKFPVSKFRAHVSSGTYIRVLAQEMGQKLGAGALAYNIKRTKAGKYTL